MYSFFYIGNNAASLWGINLVSPLTCALVKLNCALALFFVTKKLSFYYNLYKCQKWLRINGMWCNSHKYLTLLKSCHQLMKVITGGQMSPESEWESVVAFFDVSVAVVLPVAEISGRRSPSLSPWCLFSRVFGLERRSSHQDESRCMMYG